MTLNLGEYYKVVRNNYENWTLDTNVIYIKVEDFEPHRDGGISYKVHVIYFKESTKTYRSITTNWVMDKEFVDECVTPITKDEFYKEKLLAEL
jgi:hypothetical protein